MDGDKSSEQSPVYLDYNATTPLAPEVVTSITQGLQLWGNPSSGYRTGQVAKETIKVAREQVKVTIGADSVQEITFTSGGTEANHLALWSAIAQYRQCCQVASSSCPSSGSIPCHQVTTNIAHVVTSNIEHPAISAPLARLEQEGLVRVTRVPVVPGTGRWTVASVVDSVTPDTCMVTMMLANNETGIIQPVKDLFSQLKSNPPTTRCPILLHSDVAQAIGKIPVDVNDLCADMVTIVGHKFYGPRVGALYHRTGVPVTPMLFGGGQEAGLRPGTENTPMILGLGTACQLVSDNLASYSDHMRRIRDYLRDQLIKHFTLVNSDEPRSLKAGEVCWRYLDHLTLPNTLSVRVGGFTGPELLSHCRGSVEASCGAACHTGAGVSQVLVNSFLWGEEGARETVRLSVGRDTSEQDIDRVVGAFKQAVMLKQATSD